MTSPAPMQHAYAAANMAPEHLLSPVMESPRRALQNLSPNPKSPARKGVEFASKLTPKTSPLKAFRATTPPAIVSMKEQPGPGSNSNSRKRSFDDVVSESDTSNPPRSSKEARLEQRHSDTQPSTHIIPPSITILPLPEMDFATTEQSTNILQLSGHAPDQRTEGSFSSLIDYDPSNASENLSTKVLPENNREEATVKLRVETLRLRLQMAMFRITTDQMNLPLSKLQLPSTTTARPQPSLSLAMSQPPESPASLPPSDSASSTDEDPVSPVDSEVADPSAKFLSVSKSLKMLPVPLLQPTEYSSRKISAPYIASSPPEFASPEKTMTPKYSTPVHAEMRRGLATAASSPDKARLLGEDLTSSAVKGHAASGLLELKRRV